MSKLFRLKRWLTLSEAAEHLASVLNERVVVADILRLALDGHLVISINIVNGVSVRIGKLTPIDEVPFLVLPSLRKPGKLPLPSRPNALKDFPRDGSRQEQLDWCSSNRELFESGDVVLLPRGEFYANGAVIDFESEIKTISGVWDLPMLGGEALDVEHALQQEINGPEVTGTYLDGAVLVDPESGRFAQIMEHYSNNPFCKDGKDPEKYPWREARSYYPAGGLPSDEQLVIRSEAIVRFLGALSEDQSRNDSQISTREKNSLLRIIAALSKVAKIDLEEGGKGAAQVEKAVELAGFNGPKEKTIREVLAEIRRLA